ncbi:type I restriction endonuclease subunit R [Candidatus Poribacteria bacterium]|nr:type I restriction endonuclease subunit R [Candidatus Poribacteria bacterium]MYH81397.1 type I restriction endonuclease subunit R [Candidatus Poribacteria bacterium]
MNPYSEDQLIEQPAIHLLKEIGWETLNCQNEFEQTEESPLSRQTKSEVVLTARLETALKRFNPTATDDTIAKAVEELTQSRAVMSPTEANREIYTLLKDGVKVTLSDPNGEGETAEVLQVIDWNTPENNDFFAASQLWITGEMYTKRPDIVCFVNGIPLVLMEFKRIDVHLHAAYNDNLRDYKDTIPHLFWYNAFILLSNGTESKVGSLTADWEHFAEWKRIHSEDEPPQTSLETILHALCTPERLLDVVENFILFMEVQGGLIKILAKNHQYLGVNNTIESLKRIENNHGKLGVFWHTQGSGKSISMLFFAQKVLRKVSGKWTFVVVTDRKELDNQTYKTFASTSGVLTQQEVHAEDIKHLRQLFSEDHRYIFTLIHKFQTQGGERHPVLSDRSNIVVITDEAHRSQYDTLALNMRTALPNAAFIAFTGTPLMVGEEKTKSVFGDYVSVYDFNQSIVDRATVPLYYENRVPSLQLINEDFNEDIEQLLEDAELDEAQEAKLEHEFAREYHLITRDERLETIAKDIVSHFMGRGYQGKAMVISIDKATAVKMFDKVQKYWKRFIAQLKSEVATRRGSEKVYLQERIRYMEETDMAVVVSPGQNEIDELRQKGVDITPHRTRMNTEDLDTKFKDPDDPFRIVFVCAMWITGFDVPSCSTIYLDKPQRNHTLMQTIARANRVYGDKNNGLIVDYIGVFRDLEKALAIYATGADLEEDQKPIADKSALIKKLRAAIAEITEFCRGLGVDLDNAQTDDAFQNIAQINDAMERILINDETKKRYLQLATNVTKLYKAILPDPDAHEFTRTCQLIHIIAQKIRNLTPPADIFDVMTDVEEVLDRSIAPEGYRIQLPAEGYDTEPIDLSQIDFEQLSERFNAQHKRVEAEKLRGAINSKLSAMIRLNRSRMDYQAKFEQMITEYNAGTIGVADYFEKLFDFVNDLNEEDQRASTEELSEEELAVFDLLTQREPHLTAPERNEVKDAVKEMLETLKRENLGLDWRKHTQTRAQVRLAVGNILDKGLPQPYTPELFNQKSEAVYQHIYDSYYGEGKSIYTQN